MKNDTILYAAGGLALAGVVYAATQKKSTTTSVPVSYTPPLTTTPVAPIQPSPSTSQTQGTGITPQGTIQIPSAQPGGSRLQYIQSEISSTLAFIQQQKAKGMDVSAALGYLNSAQAAYAAGQYDTADQLIVTSYNAALIAKPLPSSPAGSAIAVSQTIQLTTAEIAQAAQGIFNQVPTMTNILFGPILGSGLVGGVVDYFYTAIKKEMSTLGLGEEFFTDTRIARIVSTIQTNLDNFAGAVKGLSQYIEIRNILTSGIGNFLMGLKATEQKALSLMLSNKQKRYPLMNQVPELIGSEMRKAANIGAVNFTSVVEPLKILIAQAKLIGIPLPFSSMSGESIEAINISSRGTQFKSERAGDVIQNVVGQAPRGTYDPYAHLPDVRSLQKTSVKEEVLRKLIDLSKYHPTPAFTSTNVGAYADVAGWFNDIANYVASVIDNPRTSADLVLSYAMQRVPIAVSRTGDYQAIVTDVRRVIASIMSANVRSVSSLAPPSVYLRNPCPDMFKAPPVQFITPRTKIQKENRARKFAINLNGYKYRYGHTGGASNTGRAVNINVPIVTNGRDI